MYYVNYYIKHIFLILNQNAKDVNDTLLPEYCWEDSNTTHPPHIQHVFSLEQLSQILDQSNLTLLANYLIV